ncbi:unnamed protein product, partial [Pylaiella littoralis]
ATATAAISAVGSKATETAVVERNATFPGGKTNSDRGETEATKAEPARTVAPDPISPKAIEPTDCISIGSGVPQPVTATAAIAPKCSKPEEAVAESKALDVEAQGGAKTAVEVVAVAGAASATTVDEKSEGGMWCRQEPSPSQPALPQPIRVEESAGEGQDDEVVVLTQAKEDVQQPAALPRSLEKAVAVSQAGGVATEQQRKTIFSRFSSVFSRGKTGGKGVHGEVAGYVATVTGCKQGDEPCCSPTSGGLHGSHRQSTIEPAMNGGGGGGGDDPGVSSSAGASVKSHEGDSAAESSGEPKVFRAPATIERDNEAANSSSSPAITRPSCGSMPAANLARSLPLPAAGRTDHPQEKRPFEPSREKEATTAGLGRSRSTVVIPPRCRSRVPSVTSDPPREEGPAEKTSTAGSKEATKISPGPRPAGLTPPGYRSSPPLAGRKMMSPPTTPTRKQERNAAKSSAGSRPTTGLTPPGYRSRSSSPLLPAGRSTAMPRRDSDSALDAASTCRTSSSVPRLEVIAQVMPDRAPTQGGVLPPLRGSSSLQQSLPLPLSRQRQQQQQQQQQQTPTGDDVAVGDDKHEKNKEVPREENADCSPIELGGDGEGRSPKSSVPAPKFSTPRLADACVAESRIKVGSPSPRSSPPRPPPPRSPPPPPGSHPSQQNPQQQYAVRENGQEEEEEEEEETPTKDTACSPMIRNSGSSPQGAVVSPRFSIPCFTDARRSPGSRFDNDGVSTECSAHRFVKAPVVSTPRNNARSTARGRSVGEGGASAGAGAGADADADADSAATTAHASCSTTPTAAVAAQAPPPPPPPPPAAAKDEKDTGKGEEEEKLEFPRGFHFNPNFADGFVAGRRKRRAVSGVPVLSAEAVASPEGFPVGAERGDCDGVTVSSAGSLKGEKRSRGQTNGEEGDEYDEGSSGEESGSSWETCSSG